MSHFSSIKSHCDMQTYTEQSRFRSSDSILRKFWSKDRIKRNFRVFRIERSRIASFAKKKKRRKSILFRNRFIWWKRQSLDRLFYLHSVSSIDEITTWKSWFWILRKRYVHNIRARKRDEKCYESSNKRILVVDASDEREQWSKKNKTTHVKISSFK